MVGFIDKGIDWLKGTDIYKDPQIWDLFVNISGACVAALFTCIGFGVKYLFSLKKKETDKENEKLIDEIKEKIDELTKSIEEYDIHKKQLEYQSRKIKYLEDELKKIRKKRK